MRKNLPQLSILTGRFDVHQLPPNQPLPTIDPNSDLFAAIKTNEEISIICKSETAINSTRRESGWTAIKLEGPLDFSLTGILANIATVLANAEISIFAISTYNTDYVLIKEKHLHTAIQALKTAGYTFT